MPQKWNTVAAQRNLISVHANRRALYGFSQFCWSELIKQECVIVNDFQCRL